MTDRELEAQVKSGIVAQLRRLGFAVYVFRDRDPKCRGCLPDGWPDLFFRHEAKGLHGWMEIKRHGEKLRREQTAFAAQAVACHETYVMVDSLSSLWAWLRSVGLMAQVTP